MAMLAKLFIAVLVVAAPFLASAVQHSVSWNTNTNYDNWAAGQTFTVGDTLLFTYGGSHSVDEVSPSDYSSCSTSNTISSDSSGSTTITLGSVGTRYFVCGTFGHCGQGMKLTVNTVAASSGGTPPTTPSGGSPPTSGTPPTAPSGGSPPKSPTPATPSPSGNNAATGVSVNQFVIGFSMTVVAVVAFLV